MYAVRLTTEEFPKFIENLPGDRKIEAYAMETKEIETDAVIPPQLKDIMPKIMVTYHSLVIS